MFCEIFKGSSFPSGSLILAGSASHLNTNGATIYAVDWTELVGKLSKKFDGVQIAPLPTFPRERMSGELAESYVHITYWYSKIYENNILGLHGVWGRFAGVITQITDSGIPCKHHSILPLPTSISADAKLAPAHFVSTNSRLIESTGFNLKATSELTRMLLATLHRDFGIACNPEGNLVREPVVAGHAKGPIGKILLIGASNMRHVSSLLTGMGFTVEMLSLAGGIPSDAAIEQLKKDLLEKSVGGDTAIVCDFFGSFTYRFFRQMGVWRCPLCWGGSTICSVTSPLCRRERSRGLLPRPLKCSRC